MDGKFEVTDADLRDHFVYPLSVEHFNRLSRMARVLDHMSGTVDHWLAYEKTRSTFLMRSLRPFFKRSKKRVVSETPQDALDIATYTRFSHPIHLLTQSLNWLIQREKLIIQQIFPSRCGRLFSNTVKSTFEAFVKVINRLTIPVLNSHIDCLFDLGVLSTFRDVTVTFDLPDDDVTTPPDRSMSVQLTSITQPPQKASWDILGSFAQLVEKHDLQFVPAGGGVSPLTSNVILFLIELSEYAAVLSDIPGADLKGYALHVINNLIDDSRLCL